MSEYRNWEQAIEGDEELTEAFEYAAFIHRDALTTENLHSKSEITFELAWRDVRILQLEKELEELKYEYLDEMSRSQE